MDNLSLDQENIRHLEECPGCDHCTGLTEFYLACDRCGTWGNKDANHTYEYHDGELICEHCVKALVTKGASC